MKLRSGKEYFFKSKYEQLPIKVDDDKVPNFIKKIVEYLTTQFAYAGFELYDTEYRVIKTR